MSKLVLSVLAGAGMAALIALPTTASADERRTDGARNTQVQELEVSDRRRRGRYYSHRRYWGPRYGYYRPYYRPYYAPYYAYAPYHRPYYRPGISFGFGF